MAKVPKSSRRKTEYSLSIKDIFSRRNDGTRYRKLRKRKRAAALVKRNLSLPIKIDMARWARSRLIDKVISPLQHRPVERIGDSPIIGGGTYANNATCAVSATGDGEYFIRATVAHDLSALMEYRGMKLEEAAQTVLDKVAKLGGSGGLIAIDAKGNMALPFNTSGMYRGHVDLGGKSVVEIYK